MLTIYCLVSFLMLLAMNNSAKAANHRSVTMLIEKPYDVLSECKKDGCYSMTVFSNAGGLGEYPLSFDWYGAPYVNTDNQELIEEFEANPKEVFAEINCADSGETVCNLRFTSAETNLGGQFVAESYIIPSTGGNRRTSGTVVELPSSARAQLGGGSNRGSGFSVNAQYDQQKGRYGSSKSASSGYPARTSYALIAFRIVRHSDFINWK